MCEEDISNQEPTYLIAKSFKSKLRRRCSKPPFPRACQPIVFFLSFRKAALASMADGQRQIFHSCHESWYLKTRYICTFYFLPQSLDRVRTARCGHWLAFVKTLHVRFPVPACVAGSRLDNEHWDGFAAGVLVVIIRFQVTSIMMRG